MPSARRKRYSWLQASTPPARAARRAGLDAGRDRPGGSGRATRRWSVPTSVRRPAVGGGQGGVPQDGAGGEVPVADGVVGGACGDLGRPRLGDVLHRADEAGRAALVDHASRPRRVSSAVVSRSRAGPCSPASRTPPDRGRRRTPRPARRDPRGRGPAGRCPRRRPAPARRGRAGSGIRRRTGGSRWRGRRRRGRGRPTPRRGAGAAPPPRVTSVARHRVTLRRGATLPRRSPARPQPSGPRRPGAARPGLAGLLVCGGLRHRGRAGKRGSAEGRVRPVRRSRVRAAPPSPAGRGAAPPPRGRRRDRRPRRAPSRNACRTTPWHSQAAVSASAPVADGDAAAPDLDQALLLQRPQDAGEVGPLHARAWRRAARGSPAGRRCRCGPAGSGASAGSATRSGAGRCRPPIAGPGRAGSRRSG